LKSVNKIKEYINELNDYLKTYQADHEAWLELSEAYLNELEYAKAAFCLEELILMYPHNHVYYQRYADVSFLIYINSETLELSWNIEPNRIESVRSNQIEFFQYFDVFRVQFDRTELIETSKY
jgi:tetratricopeptide (TPR) repeat protein